jgi:hypothetical protein
MIVHLVGSHEFCTQSLPKFQSSSHALLSYLLHTTHTLLFSLSLSQITKTYSFDLILNIPLPQISSSYFFHKSEITNPPTRIYQNQPLFFLSSHGLHQFYRRHPHEHETIMLHSLCHLSSLFPFLLLLAIPLQLPLLRLHFVHLLLILPDLRTGKPQPC